MVRSDVEQLQHLVEHLSVLRGHADTRFDALRATQRLNDRGHFDGLWARAEDDEGFHDGSRLCWVALWRGWVVGSIRIDATRGPGRILSTPLVILSL